MSYEKNNENTALAIISQEWIAAQTINAVTEKQRKEQEALIKIELAVLRTAYPTQARNFSAAEVQATTNLWFEIFAKVPAQLLHEAIKRFIINDRKGFFPTPGQIIGFIEQIVVKHEAAQKEQEMLENQQRWRERDRRVKIGENCSTCRFCDHRWEKPEYGDKNYEKYQKYRRNFQEGEAEKYMTEKLYCQNPDSYKYEGEYGHGTVSTILCDLYEPELPAL